MKKYALMDLLDSLTLSRKAKLLLRLLFGKKNQQSSSKHTAQRLRLALEELGPVFIKLGQALSTRPDLLPESYALELSKLQDRVPPFCTDQAMQIIHQTFGAEVDTIFSSIDPKPLACASVAQVHLAHLQQDKALRGKSGKLQTEVVIKILRPGIKHIVSSDLKVLYSFARFLNKHWSRAKQFKPLEIIQEYDSLIHNELDLRHEAANCSQMAANFADSDLIYVPQIYWDYSFENLMVMERIYGTPVRDIETLKRKHIDLPKLANDGVAIFFKQAFEDNFFHADMHPGNIFVDDNGHWIAIDFGIMGTLNHEDKHYLAQMFLGFFQRDYRAIAKAHVFANWIPAGTNMEEFETAIRMVCEPNFAKPINEISFGKVLFQLFHTVRRFQIPVQPQLVLLYKTLLNIEGLGRQLYPELNLWDTAKPILEKWMREQLSPQAALNDFKRDWPQWRLIMHGLPNRIGQLMTEAPDEIKQTSNIHPSFFLLAISAITALMHQYQLIPNSFLSQHCLWLAIIAIIWRLISKKN